MKNQIAWLTQAQQISIEDAPMPKVARDEVLIQIQHVGVCGSDIAFFREPTLGGRFHPPLPIILGHECAGTIVDKGPDVTHLNIGDKVAVEPGVPCGKCRFCTSGRYNLCRDVNFMAATPFKRGALCRYLAYPANMVFRLEDKLTTIDGAMMEPFAVGLHASRRGEVSPEKSILILGCGCIGLMTMLACQAVGASKIIIADVMPNRLDLAKRLGAAHTILSSSQDLSTTVMELTGGAGADVVFETAGIPATAQAASQLVAIGGRIVLVGQIHEPVPMDLFALSRKEVDVRGTFRYANMYPVARQLIQNGTPVSQVVSHVFPFHQTQAAFETALNQKQTAVKVMISLEEE